MSTTRKTLYLVSPYFGTNIINIGSRIELAPHCDLWMRGAKYGTVTRITGTDDAARVHVRMDNPRVRKIQRLAPDQIGKVI